MSGLNAGGVAGLLALLLLVGGLALDGGGLGLEPWCKELRLVHLTLEVADCAGGGDILWLVYGYIALVSAFVSVLCKHTEHALDNLSLRHSPEV